MPIAKSKALIGAALVIGFVAGSLIQHETTAVNYAQLSLQEREDLRSQLRPPQTWRSNRLSLGEQLGEQITAAESDLVESHSGLSASERIELREQLRLMAGEGEILPTGNRYQGEIVARDDDRSEPHTLIEVSGPAR